MTSQLLLHIGYHKTATTWMQQRLFVAAHGYHQIARHEEVWRDVVAPHGLRFDPEHMRKVIRDGLAALPEGKVPVISSEILSGHPFFGGLGSDVYAQRLKEIAPDARILVSIRAQRRILPSVYMQYLLRGGTMSPKSFFGGHEEIGYPAFRPEHFEYHRLIGLYRDLFGAENVHVLTQESLREDMDGAARTLARFAGNYSFGEVLPGHRAAYSPSYPEYAVPLLRQVNKFQKSVLNRAPVIGIGTTPYGLYRMFGGMLRRPPFPSLLRNFHPVSGEVDRVFSGHFDESNDLLAAMLGPEVNLSGYGLKGAAATADQQQPPPQARASGGR